MYHVKIIKEYLIGSKLVDGGVGGCLGKMTPGEARSPGPPGRSPFATWDKSILTVMGWSVYFQRLSSILSLKSPLIFK